MLNMTNTTLLFVETRAHEITARVIEDAIRKVNFQDAIVYTDKPLAFADLPVRTIPCIDFPDKKKAGAFYYGEAMREVTTDFALMLEWDAGIWDATKWRDEFWSYDYIGAPWPAVPHTPAYNVGNGGFTLMSKKLGHFIVDHAKTHPVYTDFDVCRARRAFYEQNGFKWPDFKTASYFAWELGARNPDHFGYHGAFLWPHMLSRDEIMIRARLMLKSEYLTTKMKDLIKVAPWVIEEFTPTELDLFNGTVPPGMVMRNPRNPGGLTPAQRARLNLAIRQRQGLITHQQRQNQGLKA